MTLSLLIIVVVMLLGSAGAHSADPMSSEDRVRRLRELRDHLEGADDGSKTDLYELFLRWVAGQPYVELMCQTHDYVGHRRYMRKMMRIVRRSTRQQR